MSLLDSKTENAANLDFMFLHLLLDIVDKQLMMEQP